MGRHAADEAIEVHEGVYLTLRGDAYHCYFRFAGKQFRRSTKTRDLAAAKIKALNWRKDAERKLELGEDVQCVSFAKLKRSYLAQIAGQGKHAYHAAAIDRHFLPFFVKFDDIAKIKKADVLDYLRYRKSKGDSVAPAQTINRENTVLRQLFKHAADMGWTRTAITIETLSEKDSARRRRHFTLEEYRTLYRTARRRVRDLKGQELMTRQMEQRQLLLDYMIFLANTGMRVDESKTLIWRNVDWTSNTLLLEHAGKTRSTRRVLMRDGAVRALKRIYERRLRYLAKKEQTLNANEKIVALANGKPVLSFKKSFNALLEDCGFHYETVQDKHALTSLRHTYATFRLTTRTGKRASVRALAKQMGTSERMIEKHYGHDVVEDYREELAG